MFGLLKKLWSRLRGEPVPIPLAAEPAVLPEFPEIPAVVEEPWEALTRYVLPLRWSLYFALTQKQWRGVRDRHKDRYHEWEQCSCPKRCKANTLDEKWRYNIATHTKIFLGSEFICPGCHWFKSPTWRIERWLKSEKGLLLVATKPPHIIDCLGWSQQRVDSLREKDLREHQVNMSQLARLEEQVKQGQAAVVPAPVERLSHEELSSLVKPGQIMIVPWRVDLSALADYGYTREEIVVFEHRMYELATKRMSGSDAASKRGQA
jgi:hypothetical protein